MIWIFAEFVAVAVIVAATVFWGLDAAVAGALTGAAERSGDLMREAPAVLEAARRAGWMYAGGIGAMMLGRLIATWRRPGTIRVHLAMPAVALAAGLGLILQWGYADPLHASAAFFTAPGFAPGVLYGGLIAGLLMAVPWDPAFWADRLRLLVAGLAVAALIALALFGEAPGASGSKVRIFGAQPIEGVKLAFVAFLAAVMGSRAEHLRYQRQRRGPIQFPRPALLLPAVLLLGVLFLGLFVVRDLGPTLILSLVFLAFYYAVTRSWVELALVTLALALMVGFVVVDPPTFLPENVLTRTEMWRDPWLNGRSGGDQMAAALWTFATGGLIGQGWGQGAVNVLPAGHTDLILAHLAELAGLTGLLLYLGCLLALVFQGMWIGLRNRTPERMLLAFGLASLLFAQWLVIFGGSVGLLPLTGVVVPFVSYGKTSMLVFLSVVGLLVRLAVGGEPRADRDELRQLRGGIAWVMAAVAVIWLGAVVISADRTVIRRTATTRGVLAMGWDDRVFLRYDPRLHAIARRIRRGEIHDRNGAVLAGTEPDGGRTYPLGAAMGTVIGPVSPAVQVPSWAVEGLMDSRLRGLAPASGELAVWVERRPDLKNPETGERRRVADRILFTVRTHELRQADLERAQALRTPGTELLFTRLKQLDYTPLVPLARLRGEAREAAIRSLAEDVPSRTIRLTIDARLQQAAAQALRQVAPRFGKAGAAVVLDVDSGQVLARAQWPDYDPGQPATWLPKVRGRDPRFLGSYGPWRDKTGIGGLYQTGSAFKVFTALAWVRSGMPATGSGCRARGTRTFACIERDVEGPFFTRRGWTRAIHDGHSRPDGVIELTKALEVSCNVFFGQLGLHLGPEPFERLVADGLEVDNKTTISPGAPGSRQLASTAFGQGAARMHAMEAARMVATAAGGGIYRKCPPDMLLGAPCEERRLIADPSLLEPILAGMRAVVTSGTAWRFGHIDGVRVYAKTGTATDPGRRDEVPYGLRRGAVYEDHSWFIAFAEPRAGSPCDPTVAGRIALAVVVPRGGDGAGPAMQIARRIFEAVRDLGYFG
ncbi:MAG: FtsW/RodA/SpoVE family cell cycle protein [bacterium]|nr:FtsW/RodA/SpoVE family cell cycle protein [bacterium]